VFAFDELGRVGIGQGRSRYRVEEVCSVSGATTTSVFSGSTKRFFGPGQRVTFEELWQPNVVAQTIEVEFLTYARVVRQGHLRSSLDFPLLFGTLLRRMALLMYTHCAGGTLRLPAGHSIDAVSVLRYFYDRASQVPADRSAIREAFRMAEQVAIDHHHLRWEDWERYSTRQDTRMKLGGLLGTICYTGAVGTFLPYLRMGEYIHVGKNTTFGLGQMALRVLQSGAPA
jgi:hypothetical protein